MKMTDMGMDLMQVKDFIEEKGMFEENPELIIDHMQNPQYNNELRLRYLASQDQQPQRPNYAYVDHGAQQ